MELSFMFAALRRRWWLIGVFIILGAVPGFAFKSTQQYSYESHAVLVISPPGQGVTTGDDRYVVNQVAILKSEATSSRVAEAVGRGQTAGSIAVATRIEARPGTDVVDVFASTPAPQLSRDIAERYVTIYLEDLRSRSTETRGPEIEQLDAKLTELAKQIEVLNTKIAEAVLRFPRSAGTELVTAAVADPVSASERDVLQSQYVKTLDTKTQLDLLSRTRVNSEIVQHATLPTTPLVSSSRMLLFAGVFLGIVVGIAAAIMAARLSGFVLDSMHVEEILGTSVPHIVPRSRALARSRRAPLLNLPSDCVAVIDQLCVHAEATAPLGSALTVAVVGTQRGAGTTTLALAMAGRLANNGSNVVLVDGDPKKPDVTRLFPDDTAGGISTLLELAAMPRQTEGLPTWWRVERHPVFAHTPVPEVRILGNSGENASIRREDIPLLLTAASEQAHVVIVDGGPVLEAASTLQLCQLADVVILAVPSRRQRISSLQVVKRQLGGRAKELVPVLTSPSRRSRGERPVSKPTKKRRGRKVKAQTAVETPDETWTDHVVDDAELRRTFNGGSARESVRSDDQSNVRPTATSPSQSTRRTESLVEGTASSLPTRGAGPIE